MRYSAQSNCLLCRKCVANVDRTSQVRRGNRSSGAPLLIRAVNLALVQTRVRYDILCRCLQVVATELRAG